MVWKLHVTVAALVEREGRFLLVEEETEEGIRFNQPAGHVEPGESLVDAAIRETLEETARAFVPECLIGVYLWRNGFSDVAFLRFAFGGRVGERDPKKPLDAGIVDARWFSLDEIRALKLRSPMVMRCIGDARAGKRYPLELLTYFSKSFAGVQ
jgi:8-oxo-dGTP pyrophosphatase MutT (NUDIX family)